MTYVGQFGMDWFLRLEELGVLQIWILFSKFCWLHVLSSFSLSVELVGSLRGVCYIPGMRAGKWSANNTWDSWSHLCQIEYGHDQQELIQLSYF